MRIGITGSGGFIGKHLSGGFKNKGHIISSFNLPKGDLLNPNPVLMRKFIRNNDIIIHTAGVNRGTDSEIISGSVIATYNLIKEVKKQNSRVKIIFLSSNQAVLDNVYGRSKKLAETLLEDFSRTNKNDVTLFRLPNVFGEGGRPFYNSVVHTFCHQVARGQNPTLLVDKKTSFIYIGDLLKIINKEVSTKRRIPFCLKTLESKNELMISDLLKLVRSFEAIKNISELKTKFHRDLFKTYSWFKNNE